MQVDKSVVKRDGRVVSFDPQKIYNAIMKANADVEPADALSEAQALGIATKVAMLPGDTISVEEIQDAVELEIMNEGKYQLAKEYIIYRYKHELRRGTSRIYESVLQLVDLKNEELKDENSNKNAVVAQTQRDYMAGEVSKDLTRRVLLPKDIQEAHDNGEIHFHDSDYFAQHIHNCCLLNLEDMLQNGTVINKTLIEKPHSFATACNIATQIIAVIASGQYGGQSISLAHLAPFVDVSRKKIRDDVEYELEQAGCLDVIDVYHSRDEIIDSITDSRLRDEIKRGVQTIQYQINTLNTSNGQTPFVTVYMCLGEAEEGRTRDDLAMIIEEVLRQRIEGTKNEKGVFVSPAFPKLIYTLEESNIRPDSPYWYLTELAAQCSAKRLVPDYISEKVMKELKGGDVYPCMGCRSFLTPDRFTKTGVGNVARAKNYRPGENKYYGRLTA